MVESLVTLDKRAQEVFQHIVDAYLESGEESGSRTISKKMRMQISPATIRNVMADLQDMGLIESPHTSAGRRPTNAGLRLFVDAYMERTDLDITEQEAIERQCRDSGVTLRDVYAQTSRVLSGMSSSLGLVAVPKNDSPIRQIEFLPIEKGRALAIVVQENGQIENRLMEVPPEVSAGDMQAAANFLQGRVYGKTIGEMHSILQGSMDAARKELDMLTQKVVEAGVAIKPSAGTDMLVVQGASNLIAQGVAEEDLEEIQRLFRLLEDQAIATQLLQEARESDGVKIFVGSDNTIFNSRKFSMILSPSLSVDHRIVGATAVIGPTRLDYRRVVPVVSYTSRLMSQLITNGLD